MHYDVLQHEESSRIILSGTEKSSLPSRFIQFSGFRQVLGLCEA